MIRSGAAALAVAACACAPHPGAEATIRAQAERWRIAEMRNDAGAVAPLLAEDFTYVGPDGAAMTRAQDLAAIADPALHLGKYDVTDVAIRCRDGTCVETGVEIVANASLAGRPIDGRYRYVTIWTRTQGGRWRATYAQETAIAP